MSKHPIFLNGKQARKSNPCNLCSATVKARDILPIIKFNEQGRDKKLLDIRHKKMKQSLYGFLRGTAQIQAFDLADRPSTNLMVQCAGDAHIQNFEGYLYSHTALCFDITDFDETYIGPFEWDLKRFALSIAVAGRENNISDAVCIDIITEAMIEYRNWIMNNYECSFVDNWYKSVIMHLDDPVKPTKLFKFEKNVIHNLVKKTSSGLHIKEQKDKLCHIKNEAEKSNLIKFISEYGVSLPTDGNYIFKKMKLKDVAYKTSGVGSIGLKKYVALFTVNEEHLIVLEIKEERKSVLEVVRGAKPVQNNGERIFCAQRILRTTYDVFANWGTMDGGKHFYIRRLLNTKLGIDVKNLSKKSLTVFAKLCGRVLALYQMKTINPAFLAGYIHKIKTLEKDIAGYAILYADQLEKDYETFCKAIK